MKYIVVPTSFNAMQRLDYDSCVEGDLIELILDDEAFYKLWNTNIFHILNAEFQIMIDDHEDEKITDMRHLIRTQAHIDYLSKTYPDENLKKLSELTKSALNYKTGLFFFF